MIRDIQLSDVDSLNSLMNNDDSFDVGPNGRCYTRSSLENMIHNPTWITLVALSDNNLIGVAACKLMTTCWAMLDTFYILPEYRGRGYGEKLLINIKERTKSMDIPYLSVLADIHETDLIEQLKGLGMQTQKTYTWLDVKLD